MRILRSTWLIRSVALLLLGAMLPASFTPMRAAASSRLAGSYADWIRAQVVNPEDPVVDRALERAEEIGATSFDQFVASFLEAYEAAQPEASAARIFTERDLSNDALITYLQRRYTEIASEAVLPRLRLTGAQPAASLNLSGDAALQGPDGAGIHVPVLSVETGNPNAHAVITLRDISPAQPQGP